MSGRRLVEGRSQECAYLHPRVCNRLLREGDRGKSGCRGGCNKLHPKMCFSSMNTKSCPNEDCRNGYHVRGTKKSEIISQQKSGEQNRPPPAAKCLGSYPPLRGAATGQRGAAAGSREAATGSGAALPGPWGAKTGPRGAAAHAAPENPTPAPFLELQAVVRQEMISFLKELKTSFIPPAAVPVRERPVMDWLQEDKKTMTSILKEIFGGSQ